MELFGVRVLGLDTESLRKLALSAVVVAAMLALRALLHIATGFGAGVSRRSIWFRKSLRLLIGAGGLLLLLSIWFDSANRLATFTGLIVAGAAFASQNAVLSVAGYFVIVAGKTFDLGDRIQLGNVRGDVLDIGLFKTTVMEMGIPPDLDAKMPHWVHARQYSGRVVTIPNAEVFKSPTYNYTRNFNFLWEEIRLPLHYDVDLALAEKIVLDAARSATKDVVREGHTALEGMRREYLIHAGDLYPKAYVRLTDNWIELTVRFLVTAFNVRDVKDDLSRLILAGFREHGIEIASTTLELAKIPRLTVREALGRGVGAPMDDVPRAH